MLHQLKPVDTLFVIDLVREAGLDVCRWGTSRHGPVKVPASNPAYCYEWAFVEELKVVLNLWHDEMAEIDGKVFDDVDPRGSAQRDGRPKILQRARRFEKAITHAFNNQLPVRVIIGAGTKRQATEASDPENRMERRLLDSDPWTVERYDPSTGVARITRGSAPTYVDQFSIQQGNDWPRRRQATGEAWVRDQRVRLLALRRARGECEFCGAAGFQTSSGGIYLETHHVTPLAEGGEDNDRNVVALCANHHREAHHGASRDAVRERLRALLARQHPSRGS